MIVFGPLESSTDPVPFFQSLPLVVGLKIASHTAAGVYRGLWRYISAELLWVYFRAALIGSMASVVVLTLIFRFQGFSRVMFVLDGFILFFLLVGSRYAFRFIRGFFKINQATEKVKKVLIYGAGDGGEILAREISGNPDWKLKAVGFLDDDQNKHGRLLRGLRVFGNLDHIEDFCEKTGASQVIISSIRFSSERINEIRESCEKCGIELFKLSLKIEPILNHEMNEIPLNSINYKELLVENPSSDSGATDSVAANIA
ncbi:MAG: nucleoside-diphosphate sugar epimerase/dehydratase [Isosphaeraceae bacterium]